jgi:hypothetical protein
VTNNRKSNNEYVLIAHFLDNKKQTSRRHQESMEKRNNENISTSANYRLPYIKQLQYVAILATAITTKQQSLQNKDRDQMPEWDVIKQQYLRR